ncbi:MAG: GNAT family N-acetyltransferase [Oscillospiraceae bacterium]|jgi:GNAT superfamily N-acetyltransferase|nr:GNAT family N-acetyltransferase [Oscillospiraceae bacterium]
MEIKYRKANTNDIPELVRLRLEFSEVSCNYFKLEFSDETREILRVTNADYFTAGLLDGSLVVFVAEDGGKIVSTSGIMFWRHLPGPAALDGRKAVIANMYTIPEYRKQGIATELMRLQFDEAKARGVRVINLSATEMGRKLYEKLGFEADNDEMKIRL